MKTKVVTEAFTCDRTGVDVEPGDVCHRSFTWGGRRFEVDLHPEAWTHLEHLLHEHDRAAEALDEWVAGLRVDARWGLGALHFLDGLLDDTILATSRESGAGMITAERGTHPGRGFTDEHDDEHANGELGDAALSYLIQARTQVRRPTLAQQRMTPPATWPWADAWKPSTDPIPNLVKAGGLIAAEIDRLKRAETKR